MKCINKRKSSSGLFIVLIILLSGCSETEVMINESRDWEAQEEEEMLLIVEDMNFVEELGFNNSILEYLSLPFTLPYSNRTFTVPNPPLSYTVWNSYYIEASKDKVLPWNRSKEIIGSNIVCDYSAEVKTLTNISGENLPLKIASYINFFFIYNQISHSYSFTDTRKEYYYLQPEKIKSIVTNITFSGFQITQEFRYTYGFFVRDSIRYEQLLFSDELKQLQYGFIYFGWITTN